MKNEYSFNTQYTDFEMMGGKPTLTYVKLFGEEYWVEVFHPIFKEISTDFIYVDGRKNKDGTVYNDKMDHMPVSEHYLKIKYNYYNNLKEEDENYVIWKFEKYYFKGTAYCHNLLKKLGYTPSLIDTLDFYGFNTIIINGIKMATKDDKIASSVFEAYYTGIGGEQSGWVDGFTRKVVDASEYILKDPNINPEYIKYKENLNNTIFAVNDMMNKENDDAYISTFPKGDTCWSGGAHFSSDTLNIITPLQVAENIAAFGTFNTTEAGITAHCTYNVDTNEITMHYKYYLVDYYDYDEKYPKLQVQDALGIARGYELYGYLEDSYTWKKF